MRHATTTVYFVIGLFLIFGAANFLAPAPMLEMANLNVSHPNARSEVRAYFGGVELAVGFFLLYLMHRKDLELAIHFSLFLYTGIMGGRLLGALIDGAPDAYFPLTVSIEGFVFFNLVFATLGLAKARLN